MPFQSSKQKRAMFAAKSGKSTIGIPQSVGAEFVNADKAAKASGRDSQDKVGVPKIAQADSAKLKRKAMVGTKPSSKKLQNY